MNRAATLHRNLGFTLIEVMMVVVLVGVVTAVVAFTISPQSGQRKLEREMVDLELVIDRILEESSVRHVVLGATVAGDRLLVWEFDDKTRQWVPATSFSEHELPEGMRLNLVADGAPVADSETATPVAIEPDFLVLPTGEVSPASLLLKEDSGLTLHLILDELGRLTTRDDRAENG